MPNQILEVRGGTRPPRRSGVARIVSALATAAFAAACSSDDSTGGVFVPIDVGPLTTVCNPAVSGSHLEQAPIAKLEEYKQFGIYPAAYSVGTPNATDKAIVFPRLTDAIAAVRAARLARGETRSALCRITITVPAGTLRATADSTSTDATLERLPWVIDVPDITVRGALRVPANDVANGVAHTTTMVIPTPALRATPISQPIFIVNAHPASTDPVGNGATIEGFTLTSGHAASDTTTGGQGVLAVRATNLTVRGNILSGNFTERIDLRAVSGSVVSNYMEGTGASCNICLAGPGAFQVQYNRIIAGGIEGVSMVSSVVLAAPPIVEPYSFTGPTASITVAASNNTVTGLKRLPVGTAFRVGAMGLGAPNVAGSATISFTQNTATGNTFGLILEAAFPVAGGALRGDISIDMSGNLLFGNCQSDVYTSFTRHNVGLGLANNRPYLKNSTYAISVDELGAPWAPAMWIAHPAGLGNTLTVNGAVVPNVMRTAYDANKKC